MSKRYFVTSDIHGYFSIFKKELDKVGFNIEDKNHYLIICGDVIDRGQEVKQLLDWLIDFNKTGRLIFIKGNHEYLIKDCLEELNNGYRISPHHISNGTINTISQLSGINQLDLQMGTYDVKKLNKKLKPYLDFIDTAIHYYELDDYIFVHGWVPYVLHDSHDPTQQEGEFSCVMVPEIELNAEDFMWEQASWYNGMEEWKSVVAIPNKTIVCGHWHCSFGNFHYHNKGFGEFEDTSDFSPFVDNGIIAIDACTAFSGKINIIVIDKPL